MDNDDDDTVVGTCATTCSTTDDKKFNNVLFLSFGFCTTIEPIGAITTSTSGSLSTVLVNDSDDDVEDDDEWIECDGGDCRTSCAKREFK